MDQRPLLDVGQYDSGVPEQMDLIDSQNVRGHHAVVVGIQLKFRPVLYDAANGTHL